MNTNKADKHTLSNLDKKEDMDYDTMTPENLAHWIFKASGYKVNYQDCKSRIENVCMKYADGDFEIQGRTNEERLIEQAT